MNRYIVFGFLLVLSSLLADVCKSDSAADRISNGVEDAGRTYRSDDVLWDMMDDCVSSEVKSVSTCLKMKMLRYFDYDVSRIATPRSLSENDVEKVDRLVVKRFQKYLKSREFKIQLPDFFFQGATLVFSPEKSVTDFDVIFPKPSSANEDRSMSAARDMMQQKALLPLLMLLKMKLKMITPIMLTLVSIKATKAMLMSKLALLLVTVFMASQLFKKLGMHLPMLHPPMEMAMPMAMTTPPPAAYGAPAAQPAAAYGMPSQSPQGYSAGAYAEPNAWEPSSSSSNVYSKIWDPQSLAYSSYYKSASSSGSGGSGGSSSSSSSSSTLTR